MKIALVLTVKNENRLLRRNLLYHQAIGVSKAFVYFDGTTDNGKETIKDLSFVQFQDSVSSDKFKNLEYLETFTANAHEHHTARQCLNTFDALQQCKSLGYDWLISLDADELITISLDAPTDLGNYFSNLDDTIELVNFKTLEVLQSKQHFEHVFAEATLFKTRRNFNSHGENVFRKIYNPATKTYERHYYWYGQTMGKAAIKVASDLIPKNVHRYVTKSGENPLSLEAGYVLHYHAYDAQDFIKKFRNFSEHPQQFLSGNRVESLKLLLKEVVNNQGYTEKQLEDYFKGNLLFTTKTIRSLLKNKKLIFIKRKQQVLKKVNAVTKVFDQIHKGQ
jgi:hypothetical protein